MSSYIVPYRGASLSEANANIPFAVGALRVARASYSFAADGGAVSTIALTGSTVVPSGAIILATLLNVTTAPTSGGAATISVGVEAAADQQAAAAISGAPWSTTGAKWATQTFTTAPDVTTAARDISIAVATAALTAGAFDVYVFYILPS
jgi:hypothetical protein